MEAPDLTAEYLEHAAVKGRDAVLVDVDVERIHAAKRTRT